MTTTTPSVPELSPGQMTELRQTIVHQITSGFDARKEFSEFAAKHPLSQLWQQETNFVAMAVADELDATEDWVAEQSDEFLVEWYSHVAERALEVLVEGYAESSSTSWAKAISDRAHRDALRRIVKAEQLLISRTRLF